MFIEDFFTSRSIPTIVKWIVMIMVTGFVAQFGKKFADFLIARMRRRGKQKTEIVELPKSAKSKTPGPDKYSSKIEKKIQKAEVKRLKKMK